MKISLPGQIDAPEPPLFSRNGTLDIESISSTFPTSLVTARSFFATGSISRIAFLEAGRNRRFFMKTFSAKAEELERKWYVIDAEGKVLGDVAVAAAKLLRGKSKPIFTPHVDCGDHVIVINAEKVDPHREQRRPEGLHQLLRLCGRSEERDGSQGPGTAPRTDRGTRRSRNDSPQPPRSPDHEKTPGLCRSRTRSRGPVTGTLRTVRSAIFRILY